MENILKLHDNYFEDCFWAKLIFNLKKRGSAFFFFFTIRIFFTDTDDSQDSRGREGTIFYSSLPLPPAHEHWDIYLQLCMWDEYRVLLIATLALTRLLLEEVYHLIELPFEWLIDNAMFVCLLDKLILDFCYSDLALETGGLELASTIMRDLINIRDLIFIWSGVI